MKKSLIALAALAAVSAASAQSSVTLYGRLDVGHLNAETTTNGAKENVNGLASAGLSSTYWGLKGSEDLGGGMKANFQLESGVDVGTGASVAGFTRISTVGLSGKFGEVKLGRDYTPLYSVIGSADVFGRITATTVNLIPVGTRASNMVSYQTPTISGFTGKFMTGQNEAVTTTAAGVTTANTTNSTSGMSVTYANGPLMVAVGYGESKGLSDPSVVMGGNVANPALVGEADGTAISASYDLGVVKLFANHTQGTTKASAASTDIKSKETNLGVTYPMGAFTLLAAYGNNKQTSTGTNLSGDDFVVGAIYSLSKRTSLYAKAGTYNKADGTLKGAANDVKTTATAIGVRHTF